MSTKLLGPSLGESCPTTRVKILGRSEEQTTLGGGGLVIGTRLTGSSNLAGSIECRAVGGISGI